jgi:hypothetical protein
MCREWEKLVDGFQLSAKGANPISIRISTRGFDTPAHMEKFVIGRVLANHEWRLRAFGPIHMMDHRALREWFTKRAFCDDSMKED